MFGKEFRVLKKLPLIFNRVSDSYDEFFVAYEEDGLLEYYIFDDRFGQPSMANTHSGDYANKLRKRSSNILENLVKDGYIEIIKTTEEV